ncbi:hypothetical protein DEA98_14630 [Brucella pseudogrignonensis]|nr:hypothetical protein [Brucella pseudogrignonensis]
MPQSGQVASEPPPASAEPWRIRRVFRLRQVCRRALCHEQDGCGVCRGLRHWTKKKLLTSILSELGHPDARGTLSDLEDEIIGILARDPKRPLIIDESDKLVDRNMIELVRMIAKKSNVPVLLIGEELFPKKLERVDRFRDRSWNGDMRSLVIWTIHAHCPRSSAVISLSGMTFLIKRAWKVTAAFVVSVTPSILSPIPPTNSV